MHKCVNNSVGNVYHLEQFVSDFFPYSQKQLGFDKPVTIRFESDQDNAGVMLGKTAYYDPEAMEVVLYTDGRHPKDVMRSLSHELVHHAQNCRGDFTGQNRTGPGYAQNDPHLRKMEREAYTKGNLIFRDFEDLIKTGKKEVDIDFANSGEPKMSLKEWKNDEIHTKLMKKWGLLKESKEVAAADEELEERYNPDEPEASDPWSYERGVPSSKRHPRGHTDLSDSDPDRGIATTAWERRRNKEITARQLAKREGMNYRDEDTGSKEHDDEEGNRPSMAKDMDLKEDSEGEETYHYGEAEGHDEEELHDLVKRHATKSHIDALKRDMDYDEDHEDRHEHGTHFREGTEEDVDEVKRHVAGGVEGLADFIIPNKPKGKPPEPGQRVWDPRHLNTKTTKVPPVKVREGNISVKEAKQITRRIIERIRKEGN